MRVRYCRPFIVRLRTIIYIIQLTIIIVPIFLIRLVRNTLHRSAITTVVGETETE